MVPQDKMFCQKKNERERKNDFFEPDEVISGSAEMSPSHFNLHLLQELFDPVLAKHASRQPAEHALCRFHHQSAHNKRKTEVKSGRPQHWNKVKI